MNSRAIFDWLIALTVFSTPVMTLTVSHGGTVNFLILILLGIATGWSQIRKFNRFETYIFGGFLVLFLVNVLSFSQTENVSGGYTWLGKYLLLFMGLFAYAVIKERYDFLEKYVDLFLVLNALAISGFAGYEHYYLNIGRVAGQTHPILFGNVSIALFGIILCRVFYRKINFWLSIALPLCLFSAVLSQTRGALIAVPVIFVVLFFVTKAYKSTNLKIFFLFLSLALVASAMIDGSTVKKRILYTLSDLAAYSEDSGKTGALTLRFEFWRNSIFLWKDSPLIGVGVGDYNIEMKKLVESGKSVNDNPMNYRFTPHSNLINSLVTSGILGLSSFILATFLWPLILIHRYKFRPDLSSSFMVTLISYFIFGISTTWMATHAALSFFMVILLMSMAMMGRLELPVDKKTSNENS